MSDDRKKTGKPDDQRINLGQPHEVAYWSRKLEITIDRLHKLVAQAGPMVKDVKRALDAPTKV